MLSPASFRPASPFWVLVLVYFYTGICVTITTKRNYQIGLRSPAVQGAPVNKKLSSWILLFYFFCSTLCLLISVGCCLSSENSTLGGGDVGGSDMSACRSALASYSGAMGDLQSCVVVSILPSDICQVRLLPQVLYFLFSFGDLTSKNIKCSPRNPNIKTQYLL